LLFVAGVEADENGVDGTAVEADHDADSLAWDENAIVKRRQRSSGF
jgi:hypothetical protein